MIRQLARNLTTFKDFVDYVIIELNFRRGNFESGTEVLKSHASMILIRVSSLETEILVKMIRPRQKISPIIGCRVQNSEKIWRIFTATEIFDFVNEIGDENPIHQLNPPIVPGFLILEKLCATFEANFIKIKFKNFITAGEPLTLNVVENKFELSSAGIKKISGEFS